MVDQKYDDLLFVFVVVDVFGNCFDFIQCVGFDVFLCICVFVMQLFFYCFVYFDDWYGGDIFGYLWVLLGIVEQCSEVGCIDVFIVRQVGIVFQDQFGEVQGFVFQLGVYCFVGVVSVIVVEVQIELFCYYVVIEFVDVVDQF